MMPRTPEDLIARFGALVAAEDLDGLVALYEPAAVFVPEPGVVVAGHDAIRAALAAMLALSPTLESVVAEVHTAGDTALVIVDWTMRGAGPDGATIDKAGRSADVLRRQLDGTWRVLVDHP
jgi:uncharacterized protein (TIGR02246 family)